LAGLTEMERLGFSTAVHAAVAAATRRAGDLGRE
jgi:hypothetical protein